MVLTVFYNKIIIFDTSSEHKRTITVRACVCNYIAKAVTYSVHIGHLKVGELKGAQHAQSPPLKTVGCGGGAWGRLFMFVLLKELQT